MKWTHTVSPFTHTPTQCAYLFLSWHCKFEPSHHRMQGQPTDQWQTRFGNMIQAVISRLLGRAWLLTTHHTHISKRLFRAVLAVAFSSLHFEGVFLPFGPAQFTFWPTCSLQGDAWSPPNLKSGLLGGTRCCRLVVLPSCWASNIQWLVGRRWYRRELNTGDGGLHLLGKKYSTSDY